MESFSADFYTNVAAVSVVLLFTKVVTHSVGREGDRPGRVLRLAHIAAVVGAAVALVFALVGIELESDAAWLHVLTWAGLAVAGIILVADVVSHEFQRL